VVGNYQVASPLDSLIYYGFRYIQTQQCAGSRTANIARLHAGVVKSFLQGKGSQRLNFRQYIAYAYRTAH
jgi:hypothetical protein